jgi:hypothetical protein
MTQGVAGQGQRGGPQASEQREVSEQRGRVTGLGGIFVKSHDPAGILAWCCDLLHVAVRDFGAIFRWRDEHAPERRAATVAEAGR